MKRAFLICMVLAFIGCAGQQINIDDEKLDAYALNKAEQIGILVGANNPALYALAVPYYDKIAKVYKAGEGVKFYGFVETGLNYVVEKYIPNPVTRALVVSEIKSLADLLGLSTYKLPDVEALQSVQMDRMMALVDAFMAGLGSVQ